ncbi:MAG: ribbon-helix-helix protein, CopG family [Euryarchaeota archaeon]|nr:ribbon-helix-helix protein, CopG family [Euryarchaeota archaeon]
MAEAVTTRLPRELLREIERLAKRERIDRSAEMRQLIELGLFEKKKKLLLEDYRSGKISLPEFARELKITLWEAVEILKKERVLAQYDISDFRRDLEALGI